MYTEKSRPFATVVDTASDTTSGSTSGGVGCVTDTTVVFVTAQFRYGVLVSSTPGTGRIHL